MGAMKRRRMGAQPAPLSKKHKNALLALACVMLLILAVSSIHTLVRTQHSAETFVKKYQNIDQSKHSTFR
jgi:hypothetical protein